MKALTFTLNCVEPLIISQVNVGDPNSAIGRDYIPGSTIRGAIVSRYLHGQSISAESEQFRHLFLDRSVCFLNAYPLSTNRRRMLPTPFSWQVEKENAENGLETARIRNLTVIGLELRQNIQWIGVKPFCSAWKGDDGIWKTELNQPEREVNVHTFRTDRQRFTKDSTNTVFRYEAIQAGQKFAGAIISQNMEYLESIMGDLIGSSAMCSLNIGKSRNAGYGRVYVEDVKINQDWTETPEHPEETQDFICISFLSDTIIRDSKTGGYQTNLDEIVGDLAISNKSIIKPIVCSGFNQKWALPYPQAWGIQAGSVLVYPFKKPILQKLNVLVETGVGDRTAEGFGRIAVQWNLMDDIRQEPPHPRESQRSQALSLESSLLVQRTVNRIYQDQLNVLFVNKLLQVSIRWANLPRSQISGLRQVLRDSLQARNGKIISEYMKKMKIRTQKPFKNAKIDTNHSLYDWIMDLAENPSRVWDILSTQNIKVASIGDVLPLNTDELAIEYAFRLMDGVLNKALKEGGE